MFFITPKYILLQSSQIVFLKESQHHYKNFFPTSWNCSTDCFTFYQIEMMSTPQQSLHIYKAEMFSYL